MTKKDYKQIAAVIAKWRKTAERSSQGEYASSVLAGLVCDLGSELADANPQFNIGIWHEACKAESAK